MIYVYANELSPGKDWRFEWNKTAMPGTYCKGDIFIFWKIVLPNYKVLFDEKNKDDNGLSYRGMRCL